MSQIAADIRSLHATQGKAPQTNDIDKAREVFGEFFGKTFYGQMLKAMRQTVGEPAYFHGGRAEEVFRSELDNTLVEHMTNSPQGGQLAEGAFQQQLSQWADRIQGSWEQPQQVDQLDQLSALRRR